MYYTKKPTLYEFIFEGKERKQNMDKFIINKNTVVDNSAKENKVIEENTKTAKKSDKKTKSSKKVVDIEAEQKERFIVKYLLPDGQNKETNLVLFNEQYVKLEVLLSIKYVTLNLLEKIQNKLEFMTHITKDSKDSNEKKKQPKLQLFDICQQPHMFLNENNQLIPLRVYENIIEKFNLFDNKEVMENLCIAFLYSTFLYDEKVYYLRRFKYQKKGSTEFQKLTMYDVKMIQNGANWFIYDYLEAKYKEYRSKWNNVPEWESFKDEFLVEAYNKDVQDSKMAKYWTTQKFIDFHDELNDRVLELENETLMDDENKCKISYYIDYHEKSFGIYESYILAKKQKDAIYDFFEHRVMCLCGYPGTGKTTVTNAIVNIYRKYENCYGKEICICTPTGKALKNIMKKIKSDYDTYDENIYYGTCHRMFNFMIPRYIRYLNDKKKFHYDLKKFEEGRKEASIDNGTFKEMSEPLQMATLFYTKENYNPFRLIIIDETSMIGLEMFEKIISVAERFNSKLLFIGDNNQLPPIEAGRPFQCLTNAMQEAECIGKYVFLDEIQRSKSQDKTNRLPFMIKNMVNNKYLPLKQIDNTSIIWEDAKFDSPGLFENKLLEIMDKYGLVVDGKNNNCSIITPENGDNEKKGNYIGGKSHINIIMQKKLFQSRSKKENDIKFVDFYGKVFYEKDRVIRTKNDYSTSMKVNGDTGVIIQFKGSGNKKRFEIAYDDNNDETEEVSIKKLNDEFDLCYGMTIHKKQGDEDDYIVVILSPHQYSWKPSSNNENVFNLIYTAVSRAKMKCILLGDKSTYENIYRNKNKKSSFYSSFLEIETE